ncbi:GFA family protein [Tropicibacter alexandrii]|uniref:GFA family protein n=1 Tax=Tropicibacter alexandrii TaxID=2267683 RepID=UPI000EF4647D|nr:GFA family protein [Tropicibacter alexandrii]
MTRGHCLCGAIRFETEASPQAASVCHCSQCRRQSGHLWASATVSKATLTISGPIKWFDSSKTAQRGFCPTCGTFLFWHAHAEDTISFSLGALENPTGITLEKHIFCDDKGDYYEITDALPQKA